MIINFRRTVLKLKSITLSVTAALYAASVGASIADAPDTTAVGSASILQEVKIPQEWLNKKQTNQRLGNDSVVNNQGLNVLINAKSAQQRFLWENDLDGEYTYIVQLKNKPVATYNGELKGYAATNIRHQSISNGKLTKLYKQGAKQVSAIDAYQKLLLSKQAEVMQKASTAGISVTPRDQFSVAFNGFSTQLTQQQAKQLTTIAGVASVTRSKNRPLMSDVGPELIGADAAWSGAATSTGVSAMGEGVIVGIIDTGINSDHASFADIGGDGYDHTNPWGEDVYAGDCTKAGFESLCNDKLIGIHSYRVITDAFLSPDFQDPNNPWWMPPVVLAPPVGEDYHGHGSHVASTAAGNVILDAPYVLPAMGSSDGTETGFEFSKLSGVAPHANVVSYQVCYQGDSPNFQGCPAEALVAAIEDAITDGVDVINFSIGGPENQPWNDPVEMAFLSAREAGISVAAAAGNAGTNQYGSAEYMNSADHSSPWLLNVAASSHGRTMEIDGANVVLAGGDTTPPEWIDPVTGIIGGPIVGGGINLTSFTGNLVSAADVDLDGDGLADGIADCLTPFPAGTFAATDIVACARGEIARVEKATNVAAGGAGGFILYNVMSWGDEGSIANDAYSIPGTHIGFYDWFGFSWDDTVNGMSGWLATGTGHTATIGTSTVDRVVDPEEADILAAFSSRGPSNYTREHLIPSVSAPGVDIYAAFADEHPFDSISMSADYAIMSGTSMASPHAAGALALMQQGQPDWTPAEIQSALQMTAKQIHWRPSTYSPDVEEATIYRAGSGRIDVANALQAGLVMDENANNFRMANPDNGGAVRQLNLPEMVNMKCTRTCNWVRTVRATKDGTWTADADVVVNWNQWSSYQFEQKGIDVTVKPATFTLKAGETMSVVVTATIEETQDAMGNSGGIELHSNVNFVSEDETIPDSHLPVVFTYDTGVMPGNINITAHRDQGQHRVKGLPLTNVENGAYRAFKPQLSDSEILTLPQDDEQVVLIGDSETEDMNSPHIVKRWITVAEGAKRLFATAEHLETTAARYWEKGLPVISIGRDDGDGEINFADEVMCTSYHADFDNFCNILDPAAGNYWVTLENAYNWSADMTIEDTIKLSTVVVSGEIADDISVTATANPDGVSGVDLDIHWDKAMTVGEDYYLAIDVGTNLENAGNLGMTAVKLTRGDDELTIKTSQDRARAGQVLDMSFNVLANNSGIDRALDIQTLIPEGLTLVPGSVSAPAKYAEMMTIDGNNISLTSTQQDSSTWMPNYVVTTNQEDALCRTPDYGTGWDGSNSDGGYVNLYQLIAALPTFGGSYNEDQVFDYDMFFGEGTDGFNLYNNTDASKYPAIRVGMNGYLQIDDMPMFYPEHYKMPFQDFPDVMIAPFWRGNEQVWDGTTLGTPLEINWFSGDDAQGGITMASTSNGEIIIEYDNARTQQYTGRTCDENWNCVANYEDKDDSYDFETILNMSTRYGDGEFEIIMAYDNLDFGSVNGHGSIGVKGYTGPRGTYGPYSGYKGTSFAYNDLDEKLSNGLVVCYDYVGPESTQFKVDFQVRVEPSVTGQTLEVVSSNMFDGVHEVIATQTVTVASNLSMGAFNDATIDEDTMLEDVMVAYSDDDSTSNVITVTGENITATVDGNTSGSTFTITPDANFNGTTEVTVTVADSINTSDAVSSSFILTVVSDDLIAGCTDAAATNYSADAGEDDGSCIAAVVAPPEPAAESSGGGSFGWLLLSLISLISLSRRKVNC